MTIRAAATVKASAALARVSSSFATIAPNNVAASLSATPRPATVNAVASASVSSLTTKGGAETTALSATQFATVLKQLSTLLSDNADAGAVSTTVLTDLVRALLPETGGAATQAAADAAILPATKSASSLKRLSHYGAQRLRHIDIGV